MVKLRRRKSSCPNNTTRQFLSDDYHRTAPSDMIEESDLDKTLRLSLSLVKMITAVDFRSEVPSSFLGLRVNLQEDHIPIPIPNIPPPAEEESLALVPLNLDSNRKSPTTTFDEAEPVEKPKKKKQKVRRDNSHSQPQVGPIDLSAEFLRIIEPAQPVFLYRKCLTPTDVDRDQNRLRINDAENVRRFITRDEEHEIFSGPNNYIQVIGVDRRGRGFDLRLSTWGRGDQASTSNIAAKKKKKKKKKKKNKPPSIVFNKQWCDLLETNEVETDDIAELWGFRREGRFCLAANFIHRSRPT